MRVTLQLLVVSALLRQATAFLSLVNSGVTFQRHGQVKNALASFSDGYDESYLQTPAVTTRKSFVEDVIRASFGLSFVAMTPSSALASGGATAGGAYLLSAKQRYNQRVISGVKSFLALDAKDIATVEAFFASQDEGGWEDFSSAGYLLANAFRTSSTKAPDNLPSVKKWKAFSKDVEVLKKSIARKDGEKVFAAYKAAEELLGPYLDEVELTNLVR